MIITLVKFGGVKRVVRGLTVSGWFILVYAFLHLGVVYYYNLAMADPEAVSGLVSIIRHTSLIFTILLSGSILREKGVYHKILLSILVMIALYLVIMN
jgi:drug/metabolite transporter (DMT)-like permease